MVVFSFLSFAGVSSAKAATVDEFNAQIQALLQQIQQLQTQIAQIQGQPTQWCHNFNTNLKIEMGGNEVKALQTALQKEGFLSQISDKFDENVASAVSGFQEKYKDEILAPLGLKYGTGFVGSATRAKLNKLYGCGVIKPPTTQLSITVLSPNEGERWEIGKTYNITWKSSGVTRNFQIMLHRNYGSNTESWGMTIAQNILVGTEKYSWLIPSFIEKGGNYQIEVQEMTPMSEALTKGVTRDFSDNYFSIVSATTPSITVLSPNGGEVWQMGQNYKIIWRASNFKKVSISLWASSKPEVNTASGYSACSIFPLLDAASGTFDWAIGNSGRDCLDFSKYQYFRISIDGYTKENPVLDEPNIRDESDNYFSIAKPELCPDINGNGKVDIFDLAATGLASGSKSGDSNWNAKADLNADGQINEEDLAIIDKYYNQSTDQIPACKEGVGLKNIENQLASMAEAVAKLFEEIKGIQR